MSDAALQEDRTDLSLKAAAGVFLSLDKRLVPESKSSLRPSGVEPT